MSATTLQQMLELQFEQRWERDLARTLCNATDTELLSRDFWVTTYGNLSNATRSIYFNYYPSAALCHNLCVASAPGGCNLWAEIVLQDLLDRIPQGHSLFSSANTMGALIGLFRAGRWLQKNRAHNFGPGFLLSISDVCISLLRDKNLDNHTTSYNKLYDDAEKELSKLVKEYLRPSDGELALRLQRDIRSMLVKIRQGVPETSLTHRLDLGPRAWLFNSLIYAVLAVEQRDSSKLIDMALAAVPDE